MRKEIYNDSRTSDIDLLHEYINNAKYTILHNEVEKVTIKQSKTMDKEKELPTKVIDDLDQIK